MVEGDVPTGGSKCTCQASEILLFPCSGGYNCGQIANQAAVRLTEQGVARIYCLAGIGAHDKVMIDTGMAAKRVVALDGCATACAKRALEHAGITVTDWVCVTDEGIAKNHDFKLASRDVARIVRRVMESLSGEASEFSLAERAERDGQYAVG